MHRKYSFIFTFILIFPLSFSLCCLPMLSWAASSYSTLSVKVTGLTAMAETLVLVGLSIKTAETEKKLNADRIESLHQSAPGEITTTLEALGYYNSKIYPQLNESNGHFTAQYDIEMGPPTVVEHVTVRLLGDGKWMPELDYLANHPDLVPGVQLMHSDYERYKQLLLSRALQLGFLDAVFKENEIRVDRDTHRAQISLILDTGKRYRFGEITFQKTIYPECYVARYVPFCPGDPYTTSDILALQKALVDTDLFRYVRIDPLMSEAKNYAVPLSVHIKPKPKNKYYGSLGYGTDSGLRGILWWEHRRQSRPGHRINVEAQASKWKNLANIRYTIPGERPATDRMVFALRATEEKFRDAKYSLREDVSAVQIKKIAKFERMLGLHYLILERYRELPGFPKKNAHYFIPSFGVVYTDITQKSPSQEGFRLSFSIRGALRPLVSTTSFLQSELRGKWVYGINCDTRLITRMELGALATHNRDKISLSLRYFTGGDQTVRGYGYKSLGPRKTDAFGNQIVVGGQYLAVGSVELERKIYKEFSGAVFYDVGQAMNKLRTRFGRGVGVGVRYKTPLGPLRVDLAQALTPITKKKKSYRIHLTFGMDI